MPPRPRAADQAEAAQPEPPKVVDVQLPDAEPVAEKASMFGPAIAVVEKRIDTKLEGIKGDLHRKVDAIAGDLTSTLAAFDQQGVERDQDLGNRLNTLTEATAELSDLVLAVGNVPAELNSLHNRLTMVEQVPAGGTSMADDIAKIHRELETLGTAVDEVLGHQTGTTQTIPSGSAGPWPGVYPPSPRHILTAIWETMRTVEGIGKHGQMQSGERYKYRQYDDMIAELGAEFRRHGVMIQSRVLKMRQHYRPIKDGAQEWTSCHLIVRYIFTSLVDGSTVEFEAAGEGRDLTDKATRKAMTMALKAALDQAFALGNGDDDPDAERPGDDEVQPNVKVSANETDAARAAREAFEARRAAATQQPPATAPAQAPTGDTGPSVAEQARDAATAQPPVDQFAAAQQQLADQLGARQVEQPGSSPDDAGAHDQPADPWDTGLPLAEPAQPVVEQPADPKLVRATAALAAARTPGTDLGKLNAIIGQASGEGLLSLEVQGMTLRSHLLAIGRTLAPVEHRPDN
jgi:hypothetical protein